MNENIKMIYDKYQKMNLNTGEMSEVIGISYSQVTKMFSEKGETLIQKEKMLPKFNKVSRARLFYIKDIIEWMNLEKGSENDKK